MPRPCKRRRICALPQCRRFGGLEGQPGGEPLQMAVDEFETIRLMDLEGLTQEQAAGRMGVARATVQAIYNSARQKLALCLVQGRELRIDGGEYQLCPGPEGGCGCPRCSRKNGRLVQSAAGCSYCGGKDVFRQEIVPLCRDKESVCGREMQDRKV